VAAVISRAELKNLTSSQHIQSQLVLAEQLAQVVHLHSERLHMAAAVAALVAAAALVRGWVALLAATLVLALVFLLMVAAFQAVRLQIQVIRLTTKRLAVGHDMLAQTKKLVIQYSVAAAARL
jgi:hypothetical protein